jgi:hypothetical protein
MSTTDQSQQRQRGETLFWNSNWTTATKPITTDVWHETLSNQAVNPRKVGNQESIT